MITTNEMQYNYHEFKKELTNLMDDYMRTKEEDRTIEFYLKQEDKLIELAIRISNSYYGIPKRLNKEEFINLKNQRNDIAYRYLFKLTKILRNIQI